ncbi:hypothetical protein ACFV1L_22035 [Kitasatospora sp. NPDC059646]|uniref:hypothetical protein n=1 Tax=Kitasatospora sp. NPDC059646 TaxID=3346893 RepID=UPI0036981098
MSGVRIALIRCNGGDPDCGAETHTPFETSRFTDVRSFRRAEGWHYLGGDEDVCPDCWKAGHRGRPTRSEAPQPTL